MRIDHAAASLILVLTGVAATAGQQSPPPDVTAAAAEWQINNEPIVASGLTYFPTHETRLFDAQTMVEVDVYRGVPIYADVSIAPFTLVYVPLTRSHMRTYEHPPDTGQAIDSGRGRIESPAIRTSVDESARMPLEESVERPRATSGVETIPRPRGNSGVWVEFDGVRWFNDGPAQIYTRERFARSGEYHGFAVYRERASSDSRIWITTVGGGLLTPYAR